MDGVRILAENTVYDTVYSWGFDPILIFFVCALIFGVYLLIGSIYNEDYFIGALSALLCLVVIYSSYVIASTANEAEVFSHIEYKVIIEDNVEFKEFIDHYEIIDQEGEIYTVKEKGDMNELSQL
jgi:hypothetical protein